MIRELLLEKGDGGGFIPCHAIQPQDLPGCWLCIRSFSHRPFELLIILHGFFGERVACAQSFFANLDRAEIQLLGFLRALLFTQQIGELFQDRADLLMLGAFGFCQNRQRPL